MTTPDQPRAELLPGYYLATHPQIRPVVVQLDGCTTPPHWRNHLDDRIRYDPRDDGFTLTPVADVAATVPARTEVTEEMIAAAINAYEMAMCSGSVNERINAWRAALTAALGEKP